MLLTFVAVTPQPHAKFGEYIFLRFEKDLKNLAEYCIPVKKRFMNGSIISDVSAVD